MLDGTYLTAQSLQNSIAECDTVRGKILGGEVALAASYTPVEVISLCKDLSTQSWGSDITATINAKCLAFFTDLLSGIATIKSGKQSEFDALTDS